MKGIVDEFGEFDRATVKKSQKALEDFGLYADADPAGLLEALKKIDPRGYAAYAASAEWRRQHGLAEYAVRDVLGRIWTINPQADVAWRDGSKIIWPAMFVLVQLKGKPL